MSKIWNWFFTPYEDDDYASNYHSGVGYAGMTYNPDKYTAKKHCGVGYRGIYD